MENKMTPEEALYELCRYSSPYVRNTYKPEYLRDIVENELKDYYALKKECEEVKWYKEHKALWIIKEILDDDLFGKLNSNSRKIIKEIIDKLPKEKLDLLKEVLL